MKLLFVSDSFKGSLTSAQTIQYLKKAAEEVFGSCECQGIPVADGGEGTIDAVVQACHGEKLSCRNIVGTVYESCLIYVSEIESVVELTKKGECGFLVMLKEMEGASFIAVNQKIVDEHVFEVDGGLYDTPEFVQLYEEFRKALPEETRQIHVRREHKNWWPVSRRKNLFQVALPWAFVIGACVAEYALQVLSI